MPQYLKKKKNDIWKFWLDLTENPKEEVKLKKLKDRCNKSSVFKV